MKRGSRFLATLIRSRRVEVGLSVKDLAQAIGVVPKTVRGWEEAARGPHGHNLDEAIRYLNLRREQAVRDGWVLSEAPAGGCTPDAGT